MEKLWKVSRVEFTGHRDYPLRVIGTYTAACSPENAGKKFSWQVPDLNSWQYDLSDATWEMFF